MVKSLMLWIALLGAGFCAGCQQPTNILSRLIVQPGTAESFDYRIQWQTNLGMPANERIIYAELLGDRLATLETNNILAVIDADTGKVIWRKPVGSTAERLSKPRRDEDFLVICSETRAYVFDINQGVQIRAFPLYHVSGTSPVLYSGLMIHGSPKGILYAQSISDGLMRWQFQVGSSITTNPVMTMNTLLATDVDGTLAAFSPVNGGLLWRTTAWGRISSEPVGRGNFIYAASEDQSLYALTRANGEQRWRYFSQYPLDRSPLVVGDSMLFLSEPAKGLVALNPETGDTLWSIRHRDALPLYIRNEQVYLFRGGKLLAYDVNSGELMRSIDLNAVQHVFAGPGDTPDLYMMRTNGRIMKLSPR